MIEKVEEVEVTQSVAYLAVIIISLSLNKKSQRPYPYLDAPESFFLLHHVDSFSSPPPKSFLPYSHP